MSSFTVRGVLVRRYRHDLLLCLTASPFPAREFARVSASAWGAGGLLSRRERLKRFYLNRRARAGPLHNQTSEGQRLRIRPSSPVAGLPTAGEAAMRWRSDSPSPTMMCPQRQKHAPRTVRAPICLGSVTVLPSPRHRMTDSLCRGQMCLWLGRRKIYEIVRICRVQIRLGPTKLHPAYDSMLHRAVPAWWLRSPFGEGVANKEASRRAVRSMQRREPSDAIHLDHTVAHLNLLIQKITHQTNHHALRLLSTRARARAWLPRYPCGIAGCSLHENYEYCLAILPEIRAAILGISTIFAVVAALITNVSVMKRSWKMARKKAMSQAFSISLEKVTPNKRQK